MNITFSNFTSMLNFLLQTTEFNTWEVVKFSLVASSGVGININTQLNSALTYRKYIQLTDLKKTIQDFCSTNQYLAIDMEIKLKFPANLKKTIDPSTLYDSFYIDFFSNTINIMATLSWIENTTNLSSNSNPIKSWTLYIMTLYNNWKNKQNS